MEKITIATTVRHRTFETIEQALKMSRKEFIMEYSKTPYEKLFSRFVITENEDGEERLYVGNNSFIPKWNEQGNKTIWGSYTKASYRIME